MTLASAGNSTGLAFAGGTLAGPLGGTGQVIFGNHAVNFLSGSVTIGAGLTIQGGSGRIDASSGPLVNAGTIIAESTGSTIIIRAIPFTNNGTIRELNGGRVLINP